VKVATAQTAPPPPKEDTQFWNDVQITAPVTKQVDFLINTTLRIGRDVTFLVDRRVGVGFSFKVGKYLTFSPTYTNIVMRPYKNRKVNENRLSFASTVRFKRGDFTLSDRNLVERRLRFPLDSTRYRNRLQIDHPVQISGFKFTAFVADEVFYDWSVNDWVRNRFAVGGGRVINKNLTFDLYYMRQNDGRARPGDLNIIGTTVRLRP
jgi:hypothetical protein